MSVKTLIVYISLAAMNFPLCVPATTGSETLAARETYLSSLKLGNKPLPVPKKRLGEAQLLQDTAQHVENSFIESLKAEYQDIYNALGEAKIRSLFQKGVIQITLARNVGSQNEQGYVDRTSQAALNQIFDVYRLYIDGSQVYPGETDKKTYDAFKDIVGNENQANDLYNALTNYQLPIKGVTRENTTPQYSSVTRSSSSLAAEIVQKNYSNTYGFPAINHQYYKHTAKGENANLSLQAFVYPMNNYYTGTPHIYQLPLQVEKIISPEDLSVQSPVLIAQCIYDQVGNGASTFQYIYYDELTHEAVESKRTLEIGGTGANGGRIKEEGLNTYHLYPNNLIGSSDYSLTLQLNAQGEIITQRTDRNYQDRFNPGLLLQLLPQKLFHPGEGEYMSLSFQYSRISDSDERYTAKYLLSMYYPDGRVKSVQQGLFNNDNGQKSYLPISQTDYDYYTPQNGLSDRSRELDLKLIELKSKKSYLINLAALSNLDERYSVLKARWTQLSPENYVGTVTDYRYEDAKDLQSHFGDLSELNVDLRTRLGNGGTGTIVTVTSRALALNNHLSQKHRKTIVLSLNNQTFIERDTLANDNASEPPISDTKTMYERTAQGMVTRRQVYDLVSSNGEAKMEDFSYIYQSGDVYQGNQNYISVTRLDNITQDKVRVFYNALGQMVKLRVKSHLDKDYTTAVEKYYDADGRLDNTIYHFNQDAQISAKPLYGRMLFPEETPDGSTGDNVLGVQLVNSAGGTRVFGQSVSPVYHAQASLIRWNDHNYYTGYRYELSSKLDRVMSKTWEVQSDLNANTVFNEYVQSLFNSQNSRLNDNPDLSKASRYLETHYDSQAQVMEEILYSKSPNRNLGEKDDTVAQEIYRTTYHYDALGQMMRMVETKVINGSLVTITTDYVVDALGRSIQTRSYSDDGNKSYSNINYYDPEGSLVKSEEVYQSGTNAGNPTGKFSTFRYDQNGFLINTTVSKDGVELSSVSNQYDKAHRLIQKVYTDNTLKESQSVTYQYTYYTAENSSADRWWEYNQLKQAKRLSALTGNSSESFKYDKDSGKLRTIIYQFTPPKRSDKRITNQVDYIYNKAVVGINRNTLDQIRVNEDQYILEYHYTPEGELSGVKTRSHQADVGLMSYQLNYNSLGDANPYLQGALLSEMIQVNGQEFSINYRYHPNSLGQRIEAWNFKQAQKTLYEANFAYIRDYC